MSEVESKQNKVPIRERLMDLNPVMVKEVTGYMRGRRNLISASVFFGLLAIFSCCGYSIVLYTSSGSSNYNNNSSSSNGGGIAVLAAIIIFELLLLALFIPALTGASLTAEKEKQTYEVLMCTPLEPTTIALGKWLGGLYFGFGLILLSLPIELLALGFNDVTFETLFIFLIVLFASVILWGTFGLFWTAVLRSTVAAVISTYASIISYAIIAPIIILIMETIVDHSNNMNFITYILNFFNPLTPLTSAIDNNSINNNVNVQPGQHPFSLWGGPYLGTGVSVPSPWIIYLIFSILVSVIIFSITTRLIRPINHRPRKAE